MPWFFIAFAGVLDFTMLFNPFGLATRLSRLMAAAQFGHGPLKSRVANQLLRDRFVGGFFLLWALTFAIWR